MENTGTVIQEIVKYINVSWR